MQVYSRRDRRPQRFLVKVLRGFEALFAVSALLVSTPVAAGAPGTSSDGGPQEAPGEAPAGPVGPNEPGGSGGSGDTGDSPDAPQITLPCGPGEWVRAEPEIVCNPATPKAEQNKQGPFVIELNSAATQRSALASVKGTGTSGFWKRTGSVTATNQASFSFSQHEYWNGPLPACSRQVSLAAMGGATQAIAVSVHAKPGCSASASSSVSGSCSSLGKASAELRSDIQANANFNSASSKVKLSGHIGAVTTVATPMVYGHISTQDQWETSGTGSATGTASFSIQPDRTYSALINKEITRRAVGRVSVAGSGSVGSFGSAAFEACGSIELWID